MVFPPEVVEKYERLRKAKAQNERIRSGSETTDDDGTPLTAEQREQIKRDVAAYTRMRRQLIKELIESYQASEELIAREAANRDAIITRLSEAGKERSAIGKIERARWTELGNRVGAGTATPEEVSEWQELDRKRLNRNQTKREQYAKRMRRNREERRAVLDLRAKYGAATVEELRELKKLRRMLGSVEGEPQLDDPDPPKSPSGQKRSRRKELKPIVESGAADAQQLREWAELERKREVVRLRRLRRRVEKGEATARELRELEVLRKKLVDEDIAAAEAQRQRDAQKARRDELLGRVAAKRATLAEQAEFDTLERLLYPVNDGDATAPTDVNELRLEAIAGGPGQAPLRRVRTGGNPFLRQWKPEAIGDAVSSLPQRTYKGMIDLGTTIGNAFGDGGGYGSPRPGAPALRPLGVRR